MTASKIVDIQQVTVGDESAWRAWLDEHESTSSGVWLTLAKKGTVAPTSLTYAQALDEALCSGWIDGRRQSIDAATYRQHFTPRRAQSLWSQRNVQIVTRLITEGRMRERGQAEIDRAKQDGRWDLAYAGPATIDVPDELQAALDSNPVAAAAFAALNKSQRYAVLHNIVTAKRAETRAARIARHVDTLGSRPSEE